MISFGYRVYIDSGASKQQNGSLKVSIQSDDGTKKLLSTEELAEKYQMVCSEGFKKSDDYTECLAERIKYFIELTKEKPDFKKLTENDKKLSGVVLNVPCQVVDNKAGIIANLKLPDGKSITDVDFGKVEKDLKENVETSDDFKFIATNDLPGAAAGIAKILANKNMLNEGFYGAVCMTGGGLGVVDIKVKGGKLEIEASESGNNPALKTPSFPLEKDGASSPALIRNFAKKLGFNEEDTQALISTGKSKLIFKHHLKVEKDSPSLQGILNTGLFKVLDEDDTPVIKLKLKGINKKKHTKACINAVEKYIDSMAQLTATKVTQGLNLLILTGPLAGGVRDFVSENKDTFKGKDLGLLINEKTYSYLEDSGKDMAKTSNFKVVCDKDFELNDNTVGGKVLLAGQVIDPKHRGNWINIPVEALK
jgi:hypothetical protein